MGQKHSDVPDIEAIRKGRETIDVQQIMHSSVGVGGEKGEKDVPAGQVDGGFA